MWQKPPCRSSNVTGLVTQWSQVRSQAVVAGSISGRGRRFDLRPWSQVRSQAVVAGSISGRGRRFDLRPWSQVRSQAVVAGSISGRGRRFDLRLLESLKSDCKPRSRLHMTLAIGGTLNPKSTV